MLLPSLLALFAAVAPVFAGLTGTFQTAGDTQVSAMMVCKSVRIFYQPSHPDITRCLLLVLTRSTSSTKWKAMPGRLMVTPNMRPSGG
jgi:hypothetical protein